MSSAVLDPVDFSDEALNDLSDYFHGAPVALHITGPDGTITRANLAELELLGYTDQPEGYVGRHVAEFFADSAEIRALLDRLVAGEPQTEREATLVRRDGTLQRVLLYANAIVDDGEFRGVRSFMFPHPDDLRPEIADAGALEDHSVDSRGLELSPRERYELYLELKDFFDNSPIALHIVGGDGLIKRASKAELASMGYDSDAYLGQHIARFHADQAVIDGMLGDLVGGTPLVNFDATLSRRDGSLLPVMIYSNSRMREGSFLNTRCFTVPVPKGRSAPEADAVRFTWPRNDDFGFRPPGRDAPASDANPMTVALKYIASRKAPEESLGFLARVSETLAAPRPFGALLADALALAVPFLADAVSVDAPSGHLADAVGPALRDRTQSILRCAAAQDASLETWFDLRAQDGGTAAELVQLGVRSAIVVPLTIRGERAGTLTLLRGDAETRRPFGPADLALSEELARRVAAALEVDRLTARA